MRSKFLSFRDKFKKQEYIDHLNRITFIENLDFEIVIKKYDSEKTFFYLVCFAFHFGVISFGFLNARVYKSLVLFVSLVMRRIVKSFLRA